MASTKTVLVVDDDPALRRLVGELLSRSYAVREAGDGKEALAVLAERPLPDLVVLDVMMPGMNGFDVAKEARKLPGAEKLPIIFLTTKSGALDVVQGINAGARHYVTKPFKAEDLLGKVKKILGG